MESHLPQPHGVGLGSCQGGKNVASTPRETVISLAPGPCLKPRPITQCVSATQDMAVSFLLVELVSWHLQEGVLSLATSMRMGVGGVEGIGGRKWDGLGAFSWCQLHQHSK